MVVMKVLVSYLYSLKLNTIESQSDLVKSVILAYIYSLTLVLVLIVYIPPPVIQVPKSRIITRLHCHNGSGEKSFTIYPF